MQYDNAYTFIIDKLENGLPSFLICHDVKYV